jgi:hypothetical protein
MKKSWKTPTIIGQQIATLVMEDEDGVTVSLFSTTEKAQAAALAWMIVKAKKLGNEELAQAIIKNSADGEVVSRFFEETECFWAVVWPKVL